MIPRSIIEKAALAAVNAEKDTELKALDELHPLDAQGYINEARAALEAVAADIWDEGYEAGEEDGYLMGRDEPFTETASNPYRASETA